jgi:hypothetical protein
MSSIDDNEPSSVCRFHAVVAVVVTDDGDDDGGVAGTAASVSVSAAAVAAAVEDDDDDDVCNELVEISSTNGVVENVTKLSYRNC